MEQPYLVALGALVLAVTLLDVVWTTLAPGKGAGPLSGPLTRQGWRIAHRVVPRGRHGTMVWVGPVLLVATLAGWITLLATGWVLVFSADDSSLLNTRTTPPVPADLPGRIWFVVYTMFTVGNGDYTPTADAYQVGAALVAVTGMSLATGTLTYAVSLASSVAQNRSFASSVFSLGGDGPRMVADSWSGTDIGQLGLQLTTYASQLSTITEKHRDFPIMFFYHPPQPSLAVPRALCALDDLLLALGTLPEAVRPAPAVTTALQQSIDTFLETADRMILAGDRRPPPPPDLAPLSAAGIPTPGAGRLAGLGDQERSRRAKLHALAAANDWDWPGR